ncbi:MAG: AMP-binding protein, partial [Ilumatobacteraceae bacterium]
VGAVGAVTDYLGEHDGAGTVIPELPGEHDTIWIASTGGTSGPPKLVRVPHRVLVQMWLYMAIEFEIGRSDTMLIPGPLHHGLGFGFALQQLYVGGRVVVLGDFDAGTALAAIAREQVTVVPAAPTILNMLLDHPDCAATDLSSVRTIISAGSPLTSATKLRLLDRLADVQLYEHYGATEAGFFTVLGPEDQLRKERSCGEAFFGSEIRVADDGRACAPGEIGLVYKRGLVQGGGYLGNAEATAQMFRDGWATVGDVGYLDDEGYLYLVDRQSDIIVSGGVNVYPAEIESTIASLEGVSAVAVIGVPDERWGESVKAFVVRRPGAVLEADDVVAACTALLASYKRPRHVEFVDELPTSAAGKIVKRELRAAAWSGHQRSVG